MTTRERGHEVPGETSAPAETGVGTAVFGDVPVRELGTWIPLDDERRVAWLERARDAYFRIGHEKLEVREAGSILDLDVTHISSLTSLLCALGEAVNGPGGYFGVSLTALEDCLVGGFGMTAPWTLRVSDESRLARVLDAPAYACWADDGIAAGDFLDDEGRAWLENARDEGLSGRATLWDAVRALLSVMHVTLIDGASRASQLPATSIPFGVWSEVLPKDTAGGVERLKVVEARGGTFLLITLEKGVEFDVWLETIEEVEADVAALGAVWPVVACASRIPRPVGLGGEGGEVNERRSEIARCLKAIGLELARMREQDFGYEIGENVVHPPAPSRPSHESVLPAQLADLYASTDGISMPDVYNGYFIDSPDRLRSRTSRGEPSILRTLRGIEFAVCAFGSDGGGGRFAMRLDDGAVVYLPSSGAVRDCVYEECEHSVVRVMSRDLMGFVRRLESDVSAFVRSEPGHVYLI